MPTRTQEARATQGIDLLAEGGDLLNALDDLRELASLDLGDFVSFEFVDAKPVKAEDEYRSLSRFVSLWGLCVGKIASSASDINRGPLRAARFTCRRQGA